MKKGTIIVLFFYLLIGIANAQSPTIKWWYDTKDASFGQSAAADIDGDGKLEIVFGCYRNDSSVYALNAEDGSLLWKYNTHTPGAEGCNDVAPVIYDVDGDGLLDVIVPSSCNPRTFCFNGADGSVKWVCNTHGSDSPPTIADIDGDGKPEILHGEFGGWVICIRGSDGIPLWEIPVDLNSWIQTAPTITDLDNDGKLDFVVATWNNVNPDSNAVYAFRADNQQLLWKYILGDYVYHGTAVKDLDNDGFPELLIGCYNDTLYCINGNDGTSCWKYSYAPGYYMGAPLTIADLDADGQCDVIFSSYNRVGALSNAGVPKWIYTIPDYEQSFRGCAVADINDDAFPDVIFGTDGGKVIALNGNTGSLIWTKDLAAHYGNTAFEFDNAPLIADFDGDDSLDVFIVGGYATYPAFQNNFGRAYMITAGIGSGPDWLMFQHDIRRQSSLCLDTTTSISDNITLPPGTFSVFPNPANSSVTIHFRTLQKNSALIFFNVFGQNVRSFSDISEDLVTIDKGDLKPGIYFITLTTDNKTIATKKLVITD